MSIRLVDLTMPIYDRMPTFPFDPKTTVTKHMGIKDLHYNIHQLVLSTHLGTHLDAPYHFYDDGLTLDKIDLRRCIGLAVVVDLTGKAPKEEIGPADLKPHEAQVASCRRLILHTGWDKRFPDDGCFEDQPVVTEEACAWMVERGVLCLAMDMPTTYPAKYIETHLLLLRAGADGVLIEGLCGLERLQNRRVFLIALPLSIRGTDGCPCRVVAIDGDVEPLAVGFRGLEFVS